jgi:hypothetical protein
MNKAFKIALLGAVVLAAAFSLLHRNALQQPRDTRASTTAPEPRRPHPHIPIARTPIPLPALPALATASVPASVYQILVPTASTSFAERVARIHALKDLTAQEVQAIYGYLLSPSSAASERRQEENWLRNDLMDKLTSQAALPKDLVQVLVAIFQDPAQDVVMRDYAVQHMRPTYVQAGPEQRDILQQALWYALTETDSSIAGTALLALQDLARDYKEIAPDRLGEAALNLAGDERCGELSRITAVQVCGRLGLQQAGPLLLQLAQNAASVPLQIASIAALGDVGDETARSYLQQRAGQADPRLQPALQTALNKINKRQGT